MNVRLAGSMFLVGSLILVNGFDDTVKKTLKVEDGILIDVEESDIEDSIIVEEPIFDYTNNGYASVEEVEDSNVVIDEGFPIEEKEDELEEEVVLEDGLIEEIESISIEEEAVITGDDIVEAGRNYIGFGYAEMTDDNSGNDGNNPSDYMLDCSGLIQQVYKDEGINLKRTVRSQWTQGTEIERDEVQAGDLMFYDTDETGERVPGHVAIYMGDNKILHSRASKGVVEEEIKGGAWPDKYYYGTKRILD